MATNPKSPSPSDKRTEDANRLLLTLFADDMAQAWLTFVSNPNDKAHWIGGRYADLYSAIETTKANAGHYFNNSIIRTGALKRSDENSEAFVCVAIDVTEDDTMFHFPPARPTAIVRTSLKHYQFIYAFRRPVEPKVYPSFVDALAAAIKANDWAANPFDGEHGEGCQLARYSRLPSGVNPKAGERNGFETRFVDESGIKYSLRDLAKAFGFKFESPAGDEVFVPADLRKRRNWICWKWAPNPDGGKRLKIPVSPVTGKSGEWQSPASHTTYDAATAYAAKKKLSGVGFVFTKGCGLVGIDLDDCLNPETGVIETWAREIIDWAETYAEISPSGCGVKFWATGETTPIVNKGARVERYSSGRFFAFTGKRVPGTPEEVRPAPRLLEAVAERDRAFRKARAGQAGGPVEGDDEGAWSLGRIVYRGTRMGIINQLAIATQDNIRTWFPDLFPAAYDYHDGMRVHSWDIGRDNQEDISCVSLGIKDFGVHDDLEDPKQGKRTAINLVIEWGLGIEFPADGKARGAALGAAFDDTEGNAVNAAWWLAERLGISREDFETMGSDHPEPDPDPDPGKLKPHVFVRGRIPPPRQFAVHEGWVPMKKVTLLQGDGGDGKTLLLHQLQASCATNLPWIGVPVEECTSVGFYTEDDEDDVEERQAAIDAYYGRFCHGTGKMHVFPRAGMENELVVFNRHRQSSLTPFYHRMVEAVLDYHARVVILDVAVDLFGGNEIIRPEVRALFRPLTALSRRIIGAVVMSTHVSQSAIRGDGSHSGSTDWSNASRSRLYLNRPKEVEEDPNARVLTRKKANYATVGDKIDLRWHAGLLIPDSVAGASQSNGQDNKRRPVEDVFMNILDAVISEKQVVSPKSGGYNYAPTLFMKRAPKDRHGYLKPDFERAMQRLLQARKIVIVPYGAPSDKTQKLVRNNDAPIRGDSDEVF